MSLPNAIKNTKDVLLERPINPGAGNDANRRVLYQGLDAFVTSREEFVRPAGSTLAERIVMTEIHIDAHDRHGVPVDVQAEDFVSFPDYRQIVQLLRITAVEPVYVLGKLDQLVITGDMT